MAVIKVQCNVVFKHLHEKNLIRKKSFEVNDRFETPGHKCIVIKRRGGVVYEKLKRLSSSNAIHPQEHKTSKRVLQLSWRNHNCQTSAFQSTEINSKTWFSSAWAFLMEIRPWQTQDTKNWLGHCLTNAKIPQRWGGGESSENIPTTIEIEKSPPTHKDIYHFADSFRKKTHRGGIVQHWVQQKMYVNFPQKSRWDTFEIRNRGANLKAATKQEKSELYFISYSFACRAVNTVLTFVISMW